MIQTQKQHIPHNDQCDQLQRDELFALQAIYLQDFEFMRQVHPYQFQVMVKPFVPPEYFSHQNMVLARITVELPVGYPIKQQGFLFEVEGLTNHFSREVTKIANELVQNVINSESENQPIVFTAIEKLRDWLHDKSCFEQNIFEESSKSYEENPLYIPTMPKFATYTPVNAETFMIWKKKFDQELYEAKRKTKQFQLEEEMKVKLSGRQFFEAKRDVIDEQVSDEDVEELQEEDYEQSSEEDDDDEYQPLYEKEQYE